LLALRDAANLYDARSDLSGLSYWVFALVPRARGAGKCLAFTWLFTKISFLRITKLIVIAMTL
jgi:hypothetical protein